MRNLKVTLAYDGTKYHGFQTQLDPALPTVQDQLELALQRLTGESIKLNCAGRTDAGVHARGQVINFLTKSRIPTERFHLAMNSLLPNDIAVIEATEAEQNFHARFAAKGKHYRYTILNQRIPSPFDRLYAYQVYQSLDIDKMQVAAQRIVGTHNFRAFCSSRSQVKNFVRTVWSCEVSFSYEDSIVKIDVTGDGFLYNMVRIIAGTLIDIGKGKLNPDYVSAMLLSQDRTEAGTTAPPQGLCLIRVWY